MKRKILLWAIIPIFTFLVLLIALFVMNKINYTVYGINTKLESKNFNINYVTVDHKPVETEGLYDYLIITVEIENKSNKTLNNFQCTIKFNEGMQKYAPVFVSESSKITLRNKGSKEGIKANFAVYTSELLIIKPSQLSDNEKTEIWDLINNMQLEFTWISGKETILLSEKDITNNFKPGF